jgi:hypothetical protein
LFLVLQEVIEKNSLWDGLNIQKGFCVEILEILAQDSGFVEGPFQRGFRGFG